MFKPLFNGDKALYRGARSHRVKYRDVVSLYPTVMSKDPYPVSDYREIPAEELGAFNEEWFGFVHCKVQFPQKLYLPVLPYRAGNTMYLLCRTCAEEAANHEVSKVKSTNRCTPKSEKGKYCTNPEEQRALTSYWYSTEVNMAVKKGLRLRMFTSCST